jgi:hypothetical protein
MVKKIEEAFNQCFERLSAGESLDSCLRDYAEYAVELDLMLRTAYDVKKRAFPIQPRPEFKYWARVRLRGVQDYARRQPVQAKPVAFNWRRTLAISMAAMLVFVIASSGTVAASSEALPDEPLYGVKIAVEQAQVTLSLSDVDRAEVYAHLAEKRAGEIVAMARQGKADKVVTTTAKMDYQIAQAEHFISKYEEANTDIDDSASTAIPVFPAPAVPQESTAISVLPAPVVPAAPTATSVLPAPVIPPAPAAKNTADNKSAFSKPGGQQDNITLPTKPLPPATRAAININRAKNTMNATTAKSLTILQNALEKAPDSAKPALQEVIQRTKKANERAQLQLKWNNNPQVAPPGLKPNIIPTVPVDKPKYIPPRNNDLKPAEPRTFKKPSLQNVLPQGGANNQTDNAGDSDVDNK